MNTRILSELLHTVVEYIEDIWKIENVFVTMVM